MKKKKSNEIKDYDKKDTVYFIDKNKPLKLKNLNIDLPDEKPTKVISLRLPTELFNKVRAYANQNNVSYTALIKIMLAEGINNKYLKTFKVSERP